MATPLGAVRRLEVAPRWIIAATVCVATAFVLCAETLDTSVVPAHAVIWGSLALTCYAMGLLFLAGTKDVNGLGLSRWKIGPWILTWYGLTFGLASVTWSQGQPQTSISAEIAVSSVLRALWLVAVAMTCWTVGYAIGPGYPVRRLADRIIAAMGRRVSGRVRSLFTPWVLYAIGLVARAATTATTGRFGYIGDASSAVSSATGYGQNLGDLGLFAPLAVCAAALQVYRDRVPGARATLTVLFLSELVFGTVSGNKGSLIITILAVVIPMNAARHRLPRAAAIICIYVFMMVVIPFNQAYRSAARDGATILSASQAISAVPGLLQQTLADQNPAKILPNSVTLFAQRMREIDSPAIIMQRTPGQIAYSSPAQLIEAPLLDMVPRAVWPGKPILTTGYQFGQQYYGLSASLYTSSAITPVGDLYRHGGWIPVIAGMFLLGCGVRLLDDVLDMRSNPHGILLVLLLLPTLVTTEGDWATFLAGIPAILLVWFLATVLTFQPWGSR